jgi:hypothetical protein
MKRFGGFEFLPTSNINGIDMSSELIINQIENILIRTNQSASMIDPEKIVSLFRIYPPQVSVNINFLLCSDHFKNSYFRFGIITKVGQHVLHF